MKPIVASFEFVGTEETALEDSPEDFETYYLFRHHEPRRDSRRLISLSQAAMADPCSV